MVGGLNMLIGNEGEPQIGLLFYIFFFLKIGQGEKRNYFSLEVIPVFVETMAVIVV